MLVDLARRGVSLRLLAPILPVFAVTAPEAGPVPASYTQAFMQAADGLTHSISLFLPGVAFRTLIQTAGSAQGPPDTITRGPRRAAQDRVAPTAHDVRFVPRPVTFDHTHSMRTMPACHRAPENRSMLARRGQNDHSCGNCQ